MFGCVSAIFALSVTDLPEAFSVSWVSLAGIEIFVQLSNKQFLLLSGYSL